MSDSMPPAPPQVAPKKSGVPGWVWIIVALVLCMPCVIVSAVLFPVFNQARLAAKRTSSLQNAKLISLAAVLYATENDDRLPPAENWEHRIRQHATGDHIFNDPNADPKQNVGFAMNDSASMARSSWFTSPKDMVLFFSSTLPRPSAHGGSENVRVSQGKATIAFADGSARSIAEDRVKGFDWIIDPKGD